MKKIEAWTTLRLSFQPLVHNGLGALGPRRVGDAPRERQFNGHPLEKLNTAVHLFRAFFNLLPLCCSTFLADSLLNPLLIPTNSDTITMQVPLFRLQCGMYVIPVPPPLDINVSRRQQLRLGFVPPRLQSMASAEAVQVKSAATRPQQSSLLPPLQIASPSSLTSLMQR